MTSAIIRRAFDTTSMQEMKDFNSKHLQWLELLQERLDEANAVIIANFSNAYSLEFGILVGTPKLHLNFSYNNMGVYGKLGVVEKGRTKPITWTDVEDDSYSCNYNQSNIQLIIESEILKYLSKVAPIQ